MNQFQIIKRDKTWRDEKKMEKQTGWRGRRERLSSSPTWLLYLAPCSLRLYKQQTWCELCQPVCIYCLAKVEVQWMEVGCERSSSVKVPSGDAHRQQFELNHCQSANSNDYETTWRSPALSVLYVFISVPAPGLTAAFGLWELQWAAEASTLVSHQRVWK